MPSNELIIRKDKVNIMIGNISFSHDSKKVESLVVGQHSRHIFFKFVNNFNVFYGRWHLVLLLIVHFSHDVSQVLAASSLRKSRNHMACLKTCHRSNFLSDQFYHFLLNRCRITFISCFYCDKSHWHFSLNLIISADHNGLSNFWMKHDSLLHLPCR
jgi:hypothetical protein